MVALSRATPVLKPKTKDSSLLNLAPKTGLWSVIRVCVALKYILFCVVLEIKKTVSLMLPVSAESGPEFQSKKW